MTTTTRRTTRRKKEAGKKELDTLPEAQETGVVSEATAGFAAFLTAQGIGTAPAPVDMPTVQVPAPSNAHSEQNNSEQNKAEQHVPQENSPETSAAERNGAADTAEKANKGELPVKKSTEKNKAKNEEKTGERTPVERYTVTIHELPSNERPRERLVHSGASALSTTELLAIQLRTGSLERSALGLAELLLSHFEGLRGVSSASVEQLKHVKGIGEVKAIEIVAAVELGKRLAALTPEEKPCIRSPQDVANLLMPEMRDLKKEHLKSLLLDSKNRVMKVITVSVGILDSSLVHPREVFKDAILASSASIIIAHNHPSGDPTPSPEDKRITQRLHEAGQLIGIDLLDHIIIGDQRWISLKERGVI